MRIRPSARLIAGSDRRSRAATLVAAVGGLDRPDEPGVAYVGGEARTVQAVRAHLVGDRGRPRRSVLVKPFGHRARRAWRSARGVRRGVGAARAATVRGPRPGSRMKCTGTPARPAPPPSSPPGPHHAQDALAPREMTPRQLPCRPRRRPLRFARVCPAGPSRGRHGTLLGTCAHECRGGPAGE
ncbi:SIP domain-containing protein [Yinghuangia sp. ASG 101]|uniref:SIP domain-containing protein n=1 Tax=Yinghuangia sp. ASG 101 TaxID=2896848 RepID=UPI002F91B6D3